MVKMMICLGPGVLVNGVRRGRWLVQWILSNGLRVASRQKIADTAESWTCRRFGDGMFVQIDFILSDVRMSVQSNWNDFMIRCVHCRLALRTSRRRKQLQQHGMKHSKPHMDEQGPPSMFHEAVTESMAGRRVRVRVRVRPACQNKQPFQGAGTHNKWYLHFKFIELIHPKGRVVGTMSPISYLFVPAKRLNHWVPTVSRAANCKQGGQWQEGEWGILMILKACWLQLVEQAGHAWGKGINSRSRGNYTHFVWIVDAPDWKRLTFLIQLRHKQELRAWKMWKVNTILPY